MKQLLLFLLTSILMSTIATAQYPTSILKPEEERRLINETIKNGYFFIEEEDEVSKDMNELEKYRFDMLNDSDTKVLLYYGLRMKMDIEDYQSFDSFDKYFYVDTSYIGVTFYKRKKMTISYDRCTSIGGTAIMHSVIDTFSARSGDGTMIYEFESFLNYYQDNYNVTLITIMGFGYFVLKDGKLYSINNGQYIKASDYMWKFNMEYIRRRLNPEKKKEIKKDKGLIQGENPAIKRKK